MLFKQGENKEFIVPMMSATRIWDPRDNPKDHADTLDKIDGCIQNFHVAGADRVLVAINMMDDKAGLMERKDWPEYTTVFGVTPWGFSMAVNGLLRVAAQELEKMVITGSDIKYIKDEKKREKILKNDLVSRQASIHDDPLLLIASSEIRVKPQALQIMAKTLLEDPVMLGIGAVLNGHKFSPDKHIVMPDERYHPWNTCLLWRLKYLGATGALMISEGPFDIIKAQEEPLMSSLLQRAKPGTYTALAKLPDGWVEWQTNRHADPKWHHENLATKVIAVERQFGYLNGFSYPVVKHIDLSGQIDQM